MVVDVIGGTGHSANCLARISALNVSVVSIEFRKCLLKKGNPKSTVGANSSEIRLKGTSSISGCERKEVIDDYSVRNS